jgi:DNA polymerase-3 subunit delta
MILFLYGEDTYRIKQKLDAIKSKYIDTNLGDTNLSILDFSDKKYDYTDVTRSILAFPFLSNKRLVVIKNLLKSKNKVLEEQISGFLGKIPESTNLIFVEDKIPDKRNSLYKKLAKIKMAQEFEPLDNFKLKQWIENEFGSLGGSIEKTAIDKLIEYVGSDLWRMSNEIQKLSTFNLQLSTQDVERLVKPKIESNVFGLIDAISQKNDKLAVKSFSDLIENGENELYVLTMIIYQFRNLLIAKDIVDRNQSKHVSKFEMAKLSGLNPYVAEKSMNQIKNFSFNDLKNIYEKLFQYDYRIKIGKIEPKIALDVMIMEFCNL